MFQGHAPQGGYRWVGLVLLAAAGLVWRAPACAQATPSAQQMVDQLKPTRTRSLRNLVVESVPDGASVTGPVTSDASAAQPEPSAPSSPPSLSLLIQFDFDSARIRPESRDALSNLAAALKSEDLLRSRFAVEGHTDAKGNPDYNRRLSQQRADAVRDFLVGHGVAVERLVPLGKGASELALPDQPHAPANRRVRVVNLD